MTDFKKIIAEIEKHKKQLAADRDGLNELVMELEMLREDCQEAYDELCSAVELLSRQV